jgi:hypothetical protein
VTVRGRLSYRFVDGHRRYADEPQPSWYGGQGQYPNPAPNSYDSGVHERPSGAFRLPEQRESEYAAPSPYVTPDPMTSTGSHSQEQVRIPVRGPEYPTVRPTAAAAPPDPRPAEAVYRTRRPVSAVLVALGIAALMVPVIMLLVAATFDDDPLAGGVVPAVLLTLGLPLTGLGLYALAGGGPVGREAWLRPPVAYLPVGLVLLMAAGLAVA